MSWTHSVLRWVSIFTVIILWCLLWVSAFGCAGCTTNGPGIQVNVGRLGDDKDKAPEKAGWEEGLPKESK